MELIGFDIEELRQLEKLLQASTNVSNIIDKLCQLELNNKHNSEEYNKIFLELTRMINIENKEYQKANLSYQICYKYSKLLSSKTNTPLFNFKPITNIKNYNSKNINRVINILSTIMINNENFHKDIIPEMLLAKNKNISKNEFIKNLKNNFKIQNALSTDINSMFLSILEDLISQKEYQKYKQQIIKIKYCISTTNKDLEALILTTKFKFPNIIHINSQIISELLQEKELTYNIIRITELKTKAEIEIHKLLKIKDSDYSNKNIYLNTIIISCYLRSILSLMCDKEIKDFQEEFYKYIESNEYLKEHLNDRISENIIINCFKCFHYDKERRRILSTKYKK